MTTQKPVDASHPFIVSIRVDAKNDELAILFQTGLRETVSIELISLVGERKKSIMVEDRHAQRVSMDLGSITSGHYVVVVRHGRDLVVKPVQIDRGA